MGNGKIARRGISHDAWKFRDLRNPSTVLFSLKLYLHTDAS